jgi:acyl-CoA thioester hydrolase
MIREHEIEVRVRYFETDAMGLVHHANYFVYFEMGRTEMLRSSGGSYRDMERSGTFIVVDRNGKILPVPEWLRPDEP